MLSEQDQEDIRHSLERLCMAKVLYLKQGRYLPDDWPFFEHNPYREDKDQFFRQILAYALNARIDYNEERDRFEDKYGDEGSRFFLYLKEYEEFNSLKPQLSQIWIDQFERPFDLVSSIDDGITDGELTCTFHENCIEVKIHGYFAYYLEFFKTFMDFYEALRQLIVAMSEEIKMNGRESA